MTDAQADERPLRLSPAVVALLRIGAGYESDRALAYSMGISAGQLSRAKRGMTEPSLRMVRAFERRFPGLTTNVLVRPEGDPLLTLNLDDDVLFPEEGGEEP